MSKCKYCFSCLLPLFIENSRYLYCTLCKKLYTVKPKGYLKEVLDIDLINIAKEKFGNRI